MKRNRILTLLFLMIILVNFHTVNAHASDIEYLVIPFSNEEIETYKLNEYTRNGLTITLSDSKLKKGTVVTITGADFVKNDWSINESNKNNYTYCSAGRSQHVACWIDKPEYFYGDENVLQYTISSNKCNNLYIRIWYPSDYVIWTDPEYMTYDNGYMSDGAGFIEFRITKDGKFEAVNRAATTYKLSGLQTIAPNMEFIKKGETKEELLAQYYAALEKQKNK